MRAHAVQHAYRLDGTTHRHYVSAALFGPKPAGPEARPEIIPDGSRIPVVR
jgi:hypothetical protein